MNFFALKQLIRKRHKENIFPKVFFSNKEKNTNNNLNSSIINKNNSLNNVNNKLNSNINISINNKLTLTNTRAFTLIELLVVIAIIGILATLAVVALSTARSSSRDAKRLADLKQLQTALEVYYNDYGSYPTLLSDLSSSSLPIKYLETVPTSPTPADGDCTATSNSYIYNTSYDKSSYSIHTCIGANTNSISKGLVVASPNGLVSWKCGENFLDERDNNSYKTIQFGSQCWFAQNLAYLPSVQGNNTTFADMGIAKTPAYGVYGYTGTDVTAAKATTNYKTYGVLYNWFAAMNNSETPGVQGACPPGWRVPTSLIGSSTSDFAILHSTINADTKYRCNGTNGAIGKAMAATSGWINSTVDCQVGNNQQTNNPTGFNGLPAGIRYCSSGGFGIMSNIAYFWSSSGSESSTAVNRYLSYNRAYFGESSSVPAYGFSVRCLKN